MIKIAIVEDCEQDLECIRRYLHQYAEEHRCAFHIASFSDGMSFDSEDEVFDIVFMDIRMPHMNGLETAERLRKRDKKTCIIFLTNMAKLAIKGYQVDALNFIVKPINYFTLIDFDAFANCTALTDIYFAGSKDAWTAIEIGSNNDVLSSVTVHYNYKG